MLKMTRKKSGILIGIASMLIVCVTLAMSYAYYQKTKTQLNNNIIATSCLALSLTGENEINLEKVVPISDEEGKTLTPYTFTIENTCEMAVNYQVNLETLIETTLQNTSVRVELDGTSKLYSEYSEGIKSIENSKESKKLTEGILEGNKSKTHNLRLWLDKDTPMSEQGKFFESKITITANAVSTGTGGSNTGNGDNGDNQGGTGTGETELFHASYAVRREIESTSSAWERIGYSIGKEANAQIGTEPVKNDFDNIYPWSDIKSYNYDTGTGQITAWYGEPGFTFTPTGNVEVLTYIPEFYYTRYQTDGYEYILISKEYQDGFTESAAFSIGRYTMSGSSDRVHSRSGQTPLVNTTITEFRTYARNLGTGFGQLDYHYFILQLLYLVEYADYNSQAKLGSGYTNTSNTVAITSGGCNELGMKSGSVTNDGKHSVIYRGIEDIFGNVWQFVDGINIQDNQAYINYNPSTYQVDTFTGDYKKIGYINSSSDEWISKLGYDAANQLVAFPIKTWGSSYITDYYYQDSGNRIALVGGRWADGLNCGLWYWNFVSASSYYSVSIGARLLKTS